MTDRDRTVNRRGENYVDPEVAILQFAIALLVALVAAAIVGALS